MYACTRVLLNSSESRRRRRRCFCILIDTQARYLSKVSDIFLDTLMVGVTRFAWVLAIV